MQIKYFIRVENGKRFLFLFALPYRIKAWEFEVRPGSAKNVLPCDNVHAYRVKDGRRHKAGNKTPPDQIVELKLIGSEIWLDKLRCQCHICWANRFMCVLGGRFGLRCTSLSNIGLTKFLPEIRLQTRLCFIGDTRGVGTHIGNQTLKSTPAEFNPFVKLLGQAHGLLRFKVEP